jgi:DNA-binding MarR family transcriptional regulator
LPKQRSRPSALDGDIADIVNGLRRIVRAIEEYSHEVHRRYAVTGPQLWALKTLRREGPLPTGALAAALAVRPSTLSLLINRLVRRGLIRRVRSKSDRRFVTIQLTDTGSRLAGRAPEAAQGRLLHGLRAMSSRERRITRRIVAELVKLMEATNVDVRFFFSDD